MNAQRLIELFDRISDAPDAVPRLRRFILDLAVRGKLVPQDSNDEPATQLLIRIDQQKAELGMLNERPKQKALRSGNADEIPFPIPNSWSWTNLAQIGFINPKNNADDNLNTSFIPMTLIPAEYGRPHQYEIRRWGDIKKGFTHFANGDVGLAKITPCFENGKSTIFQNLVNGIGAGTTELHIIRPIFTASAYILIFLKSSHFIKTGIPIMTGTAGQKRVPLEYFATTPFPLPPLNEQYRIVKEVDELMRLCDHLEARQTENDRKRDRVVFSALNHLTNGADPEKFRDHARFYINHLPRLTTRPEHIQQFRQTILDLAVRGKLVPQDSNDEPTSELIARIQSRINKLERATVTKKHELLAIPSEIPFQLPRSWTWVKIGKIAKQIDYGTSFRAENSATGIPVINMGHVQDGQIILENHKKVSQTIDDLPRLFLNQFDLLYNRTNSAELVGKTGIYTGANDNYTFASYLIRIRFFTDLTDAEFVNLAMNAPYFRETQIIPQLQQQCGQANVNGTKLKNMLVPLPPLGEQHRIVAKVKEIMIISDEIRSHFINKNILTEKAADALFRFS